MNELVEKAEACVLNACADNFVRPLALPNRDAYIIAIDEITGSMTFFLGEPFRTTSNLLREAIVLLRNAVLLFERGFFDAAFYSLRQSVEVASTFVYFSELSEEDRKEKIANWESHIAKFPGEGEMLRQLESCGNMYKELKVEFPDFFERLTCFRKKINKYVHKQGYKCFYTYLAFHMEQTKTLTEEFEWFLNESITIVVVFRMILDPLPLLLLDDELCYRLPGVPTFPFSPEFVEKYMGGDFLEKYKKTTLYKTFEESVLQKPKYSETMYAFKNDDVIPRDKIAELECHLEDFSLSERIVLQLVKRLEKITRIHLLDGLITYFTDKPGVIMNSYSSREFVKLRQGEERDNLLFRDGYLSLVCAPSDFGAGEDCYFIETLEPFLEEELVLIKAVVKEEVVKYNLLQEAVINLFNEANETLSS